MDKENEQPVVIDLLIGYSQFITILMHSGFLSVGCNPKISSFAQTIRDDFRD
jgi:hypothetical protein